MIFNPGQRVFHRSLRQYAELVRPCPPERGLSTGWYVHREGCDRDPRGYTNQWSEMYLDLVAGPPTAPQPEPAPATAQPQRALDTQVGGAHYKKYKIQPIEYAHANKMGPCEFNVLKYITRHKDKNGLEDLKKARHMIDVLIALEYPETANAGL